MPKPSKFLGRGLEKSHSSLPNNRQCIYFAYTNSQTNNNCPFVMILSIILVVYYSFTSMLQSVRRGPCDIAVCFRVSLGDATSMKVRKLQQEVSVTFLAVRDYPATHLHLSYLSSLLRDPPCDNGGAEPAHCSKDHHLGNSMG